MAKRGRAAGGPLLSWRPGVSKSNGAGRDSGFTLIELIIVVAVLPLVIGAIAAAIIVGFTDSSGVQSKISDSHDAQITSAYFVRDVQSAQAVTTETATSLCPTNGTANQILGLYWTIGGNPVYVTYGTSPATPPLLIRRYCYGSAPEVDSTISEDLFATLTSSGVSNACGAGVSSCAISGLSTEATIAVRCLDGTVTCAQGGLVPTYPVNGMPGIGNIVLTVTENQSHYQYSLTASPRNQAPINEVSPGTTLPPGNGPLPPGSTAPAMLLLGSGSSVLDCGGSGHGGPVTVNGTAAVNSSAPGSLTFGGGDTLTASQVYSEDSSTSGATAPVQPPSAYTSTSTQPYASGGAYPDPYSNLPDPSVSGMPVYSTTSTLPGPGVYTQPVALTSSTTIPAGTYIFENGLSVSGNPGTTLSGTGVLFFIGIPNALPSVSQPAFYSVSGNAVVKITAPTTGTYTGIVIFQSRHDSNAMTISGNGSNSTYGGILYAPDASVQTSGNGATFAGSIIADSLLCGGNGGVSIGFAGVQTVPASASIALGASNNDRVSVIGTPERGAPTGSVTFYVCGPTASAVPCTSKTTQVGASPIPVSPGASNTSTATSLSYSPSAAGTWCFAGYYSGDPNYGPSSDTSVNECFAVSQPLITINFPVSGRSYSHVGGGNGTWQKSDPAICLPSPPSEPMCGAVTDNGANITSVQISLQGPSGKCWDGTLSSGIANFTLSCDNFLSPTVIPSLPAANVAWTEPWSESYFGSTGSYALKIRAIDANGSLTTTTSTFTIT